MHLRKWFFRAGLTWLGLGVALLVFGFGLYRTAPVSALKGRFAYLPMRSSLERMTGLKEESVVRLGDISPYLVIAVLTNEDGNFLIHSGLDSGEIRRAVSDRLFRGRRLRGASTISQQLVKNVFLSAERSFSRKFLEAIYSIKLEREFTKEEILSLYLHVAQFGSSTYGVGEATGKYFNRKPRDLDIEEAVLLVMVLPEPEGRGRRLEAEELNDRDRGFLRRLLLRTHAVLDHFRGYELDKAPLLDVLGKESISGLVDWAQSRSYSKEVRAAAARSLLKIGGQDRFLEGEEKPR